MIVGLLMSNILSLMVYFMGFWVPVSLVPIASIVFRAKASQKTLLMGIVAGIFGHLLFTHIPALQGTILPAFFIGLLCNGVVFTIRYFFIDKQQRCSSPKVEQSDKKLYRLSLLDFLTRHFWQPLNPYQLTWAPVSAFAVFILGVYVASNFIFPHQSQNLAILISLKSVGGMLCLVLVLQPYWSQKLKSYFPLLWHLTILFCLPFMLMYQCLSGGLDAFGLTNLCLGLFFMAILVSWRVFLTLLSIGLLSAYGLCRFFDQINADSFSNENKAILIFCIGFSTLMAYVFSRRKEAEEETARDQLRAHAGHFAHDIATPLSAMQMRLATLKLDLKALEKELGKELDTRDIAAMERMLRRIEGIRDMSMAQIRELKPAFFSQSYSLKALIQESISSFEIPFLTKPQDSIEFHLGQSKLMIQTHEPSFISALHNLYKNAFEAIQETGKKPKLKIILTGHTVILEDNGPGMTPDQLEKAFQPLVSSKPGGTGIGMNFVQKVCFLSGGLVSLTSEKGRGLTVKIDFE